jgi:hypothetical protein
MKKITASQWAKISKQIHSLSDIITAGYIHLINQDSDDDFGTADLSGDSYGSDSNYGDDSHFVDALKYSMINFPKDFNFEKFKGFPYSFDSKKEKIEAKAIEPVCTCGAWKAYGKKSSLSMHSSWCDLRQGR